MLIGIDLGTTNTSVSYVDKQGKLRVLPLGKDKKSMPSVVSVVKGEIFVGEVARRQALVNASQTVFDAKRILGRKFTDVEVQNSLLKYPYRLIKGDRNQVKVLLDQNAYSVEQLLSFLIQYIKKTFHEFTGQEVTSSVITVPAYFNNAQRQAMMNTANLADLHVQRLISEPTAAAMAYGYYHKDNRKVAVYDLGGGTFDISLLEMKDNTFKVLGSYGDTFLGGSDIDHHLFEHICHDIWDKHKIYIKDSPVLTYKVRSACENVKKELSVHRKVSVEFPFLRGPKGNVVSYQKIMDRQTLEMMSKPIIERTLLTAQRCLERSGLKKSDLDDVVLVGGQSKMPMVMDRVSNFFGRTVAKIINPDEIVSAGAAIYGDAVTTQRKSNIVLLDVLPQSMSVRKNLKTKSLFKSGQRLPLSKVVTINLDDGEDNDTLYVDQGDAKDIHPSDTLGSFKVTENIKPGQKQAQVKFSVNESGLLNVGLQADKGKFLHLSGLENHGLNKTEIKEAQKHRLEMFEGKEVSKQYVAKRLNHLLARVQGLYLDQKAMFSLEQKGKIEKIFELGPVILNHGDEHKMLKMLDSLFILEQQLSS